MFKVRRAKRLTWCVCVAINYVSYRQLMLNTWSASRGVSRAIRQTVVRFDKVVQTNVPLFRLYKCVLSQKTPPHRIGYPVLRNETCYMDQRSCARVLTCRLLVHLVNIKQPRLKPVEVHQRLTLYIVETVKGRKDKERIACRNLRAYVTNLYMTKHLC